MDDNLWIYVFMDTLGVLSTFVVLVAAGVTAWQLTKTKQGAAGGWLLVLACAGSWLISLGSLALNLLAQTIGFDSTMVIHLLLRTLTFFTLLLMIPAFLLIRPNQEKAHG